MTYPFPLVEIVTKWGYNIEQASDLAKAASVYYNVGDGLADIGEASDSIISTMHGFNIEASNAMGIVDKFNEVGKLLPLDNYNG